MDDDQQSLMRKALLSWTALIIVSRIVRRIGVWRIMKGMFALIVLGAVVGASYLFGTQAQETTGLRDRLQQLRDDDMLSADEFQELKKLL